MIKKIALITSIGLVLILAIASAMFLRPDLSKEDLAKYWQAPSQFLTLPSGAVAHFRDEGNSSGPVLVLIHGGTSFLHDYEPWIEHLSDEFRLIRVDLPAHGLTGRIPSDIYSRSTMVEFLDEFLTTLNVDRFSLAGHSMGGGVILQYALDHKEKVEALVLIGPEGITGGEPYFFLPEDVRAEMKAGHVDTEINISLLDRLMSKLYFSPDIVATQLEELMYFDGSNIQPEEVQAFVDISRYADNRYANMFFYRQYGADLLKNGPDDLRPRLKEITIPVLIQIGQADLLVPVAAGEAFHEELPNSELIIYERTGHMIMDEAPLRTTADVARFLNENI